jgi:hypothetical protein
MGTNEDSQQHALSSQIRQHRAFNYAKWIGSARVAGRVLRRDDPLLQSRGSPPRSNGKGGTEREQAGDGQRTPSVDAVLVHSDATLRVVLERRAPLTAFGP